MAPGRAGLQDPEPGDQGLYVGTGTGERRVAKPHRALKVDDRIEIRFGEWTRILQVVELRDKPLPKAEAQRVYEDLSPPRPPRPRRDDPGATKALREQGAGRPTKRERRQLERLRRR